MLTIASIWIGLWTYRSNEQRRAVDYLMQLEGTYIHYDRSLESHWVPWWVSELLGEHYLLNVTRVTLQEKVSSQRFPNLVQHLMSLRSLEGLHLNSVIAVDDDYRHLKRLGQVSQLQIGSNSGFATGSGLKHLQGMKNIRSLTLSGDAITNEALSFAALLPSVETFWIESRSIDDEGLLQLKDCPSLRELTICRARRMSESLMVIANIGSLETVAIYGVEVKYARENLVAPTENAPHGELPFVLEENNQISNWEEHLERWGAFEVWFESLRPGLELQWYDTII